MQLLIEEADVQNTKEREMRLHQESLI